MKRTARLGLVLLAAALLAACSGPAGPQKERLVPDPDFGVGGLAVAADSAAPRAGDFGLALVRHEDGSLLLAGVSCTVSSAYCHPPDWAAAAWRFLPGGGLDGGFATSGTFLADGVSRGRVDLVVGVLAVAGNDLLVGSVETGAHDLNGYLWALDAAGGAPSEPLGGAGTAEYDGAIAGGGHDLFTAVAPAGSGFWIAGGAAPDQNGAHYRTTVWKLDLNGNKDPTFDADGVWSSSRNVQSWAMAIALDGDGRPVVAGVTDDIQTQATVWRLEATGGLDAGFQGGRVTLSSPDAQATYARAVMMDEDRIVVAGSAKTADGEHPVLWRLGADGTLDADFGDGGVLLLPERTDASGAGFWRQGMALAKDEKGRYLLAGGAKSDDGDLDAAVWRILPNGKEDPDFCGGGPCTFDRAGQHDWATRLILDPEGTLFLGGWASGADGDPDAAIWKLHFEAAR